MKSSSFSFQQFTINQNNAALKVGTDAVLLGAFTSFTSPFSILDIGTGTGILALIMAQKHSCSIDAIEIDTDSCTDALDNFNMSKWAHKISLYNETIQDFAKTSNIQYDGIICNPPFFSNSLQTAEIAKTNAKHTTTLTHKELMNCASKLLTNDGSFYIIIPVSEKTSCNEAAMHADLYIQKEIYVYPYPESEANRIIIVYGKTKQSVEVNSITIRNADRTYSEAYKELTKDLYLKIAD